MNVRLSAPPKTSNLALDRWLQQATDALNSVPAFSVFSFSTPNSNVTAAPSTLGVNLASATTLFWLKQTGSGNTGWVSLSTA